MISKMLVDYDELRRISRLGPNAQRATVERWAQQQGILYKPDGHGGIWTTMDAMNAALGLPDKQQHDAANEPYSADQVL